MAKKCKTALVEPPKTVTNLMAFSSDFLVTMSLGLRSFSTSNLNASPAATLSSLFSSLMAGLDEL